MKVTGIYSQCSRNKMVYCDFFDKAEFICDHTDRYWDKSKLWSIWQVMVSAISQIPSLYVACFSLKIWSIMEAPVICSPYSYYTNWDTI